MSTILSCEAGETLNRLSSEELEPFIFKANILGKLYNIFGKPINLVNSIKKSSVSEGRKKVLIKREKARYTAHKNLISFILKEINAEALGTTEQLKTAEAMLNALIINGDKQFLGITDMNNIDRWDSGKIVAVKNFYRKLYSIAKAKKKISKTANTILPPWVTAARYDITGRASAIVYKSQNLLDEILHVVFDYTEKIERHNARLINQVGKENEEIAHTLVRNISNTRTRYFVPLSRKIFSPTAIFDKKLGNSMRNALNNFTIDGIKYTNFTLSSSEINALNIQREKKGLDRLDNVNGKIYATYTLDSKVENKLTEGFWEAEKFKEFEGIRHPDDTNKRGWANFKIIEKQPSKGWFISKGVGKDSPYITVWNMVTRQREIFEEIHDKISEMLRDQTFRRTKIGMKIIERFGEEISADIDGLGGDGTMLYQLGKTLYTGSSYLGKVSNFDPNMYHLPVYWGMLQKERGRIAHMLNTANEDIDTNLRNLRNPDFSKEEKEGYTEDLLAARTESLRLIKKAADFEDAQRHSADGIHSARDAAKHNQAKRLVEQKHRVMYTDPTLRRTDKDVVKDYVYSIFRGALFNDMKLSLMENMLELNTDMAEFIADQVAASTGSASVQAGVLGIDYSNPKLAQMLGKIFKNSDIEITDKMIQKAGQFHNALVVANNLGSATALTNNFQRFSLVNDETLKDWLIAADVLGKGTQGITSEEMMNLVRATGVLDPIRAFTDMLTAGMVIAGDWDFVMPWVDVYRLGKLTRKKFTEDNDSFDTLIESHLKGKTPKQIIEIKAIKDIKKQIYDIVHKKIKDPSDAAETDIFKAQLRNLKLGLTEDYINRLVYWKLGWFKPTSGKAIFTMAGSEEQMRAEAAVMGFLRAESDGMLSKTGPDRYGEPNAIRMARLYVYNTMFGMSSQYLPKMFRGAFGKWWNQFKSYQYHQFEHDWKYISNFIRSEEKKNPFFTTANLSVRLSKELMRMMGGRLVGISKETDIVANKLLKFILVRGSLSAISLGMFYVPILGWTLQNLVRKVGYRSFVGFRAVRGLESPVFTYPLRAMYLAFMLGTRGFDADDEEEERTIQDFLMDWTPPLLNMLINFAFDGVRAVRPYVPFFQYGDKVVTHFIGELTD